MFIIDITLYLNLKLYRSPAQVEKTCAMQDLKTTTNARI